MSTTECVRLKPGGLSRAVADMRTRWSNVEVRVNWSLYASRLSDEGGEARACGRGCYCGRAFLTVSDTVPLVSAAG